MSIKSDLSTKTAPAAAYSVPAPCSSDIVSGALRRAYNTPDRDVADFTALLRQIDHVDCDRPPA